MSPSCLWIMKGGLPAAKLSSPFQLRWAFMGSEGRLSTGSQSSKNASSGVGVSSSAPAALQSDSILPPKGKSEMISVERGSNGVRSLKTFHDEAPDKSATHSITRRSTGAKWIYPAEIVPPTSRSRQSFCLYVCSEAVFNNRWTQFSHFVPPIGHIVSINTSSKPYAGPIAEHTQSHCLQGDSALKDCLSILVKALGEKKGVLVYDSDGLSDCIAVTVAFLLLHSSLSTADEVFGYLNDIRPTMQLTDTHIKQITDCVGQRIAVPKSIDVIHTAKLTMMDRISTQSTTDPSPSPAAAGAAVTRSITDQSSTTSSSVERPMTPASQPPLSKANKAVVRPSFARPQDISQQY